MGNTVAEPATESDTEPELAPNLERSPEIPYCISPTPPAGENVISGARTCGSEMDSSRRSADTSTRSRSNTVESEETKVMERYSTPAVDSGHSLRRNLAAELQMDEGESTTYSTPPSSPVRRRSSTPMPGGSGQSAWSPDSSHYFVINYVACSSV